MEEEYRAKVIRSARGYHKELVEFCRKLVKTPSVNGEDNEGELAALVAKKARELGLPYQFISLDEKRPNIFVGRGFKKRTGLLFVAHLDTVPVGDEGKWTHPPFAAEIKKGKLFGRGAIDCKAGIALSLYTLKVLNDVGKPELAKFAGVVDEESGADSELGARLLLTKGLGAAAAIYTYPGIDTVTIGHRGLVRIWVEVQGEGVHTGSKRWQDGTKGANAVEALARFINRLSEITAAGTHRAFPGYGFKQTPTLLEGGSGESIVPDRAKVLLDARLLPNQSNEKYIKLVQSLARRSSAPKIRFSVTVETNIPGMVISPDEKIVQILRKLDKEVMGVDPEVRGTGAASEGYMFVEAGIPIICGFGAEGNGAHATDEYLELESLPKVLELYARAAVELSS